MAAVTWQQQLKAEVLSAAYTPTPVAKQGIFDEKRTIQCVSWALGELGRGAEISTIFNEDKKATLVVIEALHRRIRDAAQKRLGAFPAIHRAESEPQEFVYNLTQVIVRTEDEFEIVEELPTVENTVKLLKSWVNQPALLLPPERIPSLNTSS